MSLLFRRSTAAALTYTATNTLEVYFTLIMWINSYYQTTLILWVTPSEKKDTILRAIFLMFIN